MLSTRTSNFDGLVYVPFTAYVRYSQFYVTASTTTSLAKKAHSYSLFFFNFFLLHKVQSSKNSFLHISRSPVEIKVSRYADLLSKGLDTHVIGIA